MFEIIKIYTKNAQNFIQSYKEAITVDIWLVFYFDYANSELEKQNRNMYEERWEEQRNSIVFPPRRKLSTTRT